METLHFEYPATQPLPRRAHVGVVGSGDLEVLMVAANRTTTRVRVRTSVNGFQSVWTFVLDRFFAEFPYAADVDINDFGATPGAVNLRLLQIAEEVTS